MPLYFISTVAVAMKMSFWYFSDKKTKLAGWRSFKVCHTICRSRQLALKTDKKSKTKDRDRRSKTTKVHKYS